MVKLNSIMSWLFGAPRVGLDPLDDRYYGGSHGALSTAGVRVDADTAMRVSAVYRCVSIVANILAMFPKGMFERLERGRQAAPDHPLDPLISFRPNRRQSAFEFWRQVCFYLVLRQNAYVQIVPGPTGRGWVGQLVPLHPDRVDGPEELANGRLRYVYRHPDGRKLPMIGGIDIWHISGLSSDGLKGLSMLDVATDSIGVSIAAERHASRFFERGVKTAGVLEHPGKLDQPTADAMGDSFRRKWGGEAGVGGVPVLWSGVKFTPVSMTLKDAEFLDSRKFSVSEIARWFGVPPHMVGDVERSTSWGTGIEQQGLHFLIYSLQPWVELLEQSIRFTLVVQPEKFYPKFNVNALLRMDSTTQASVFATMIDKGILNPNECRELLERNPRTGGDEYVDVSKPEPAPAPRLVAQPPDEDEEEDDEEDDEVAAALASQAAQVAEAAQAAEVSRKLAEARAIELRNEEGEALVKITRKHAECSDEWRAAVKTFYGRFARRIAATGLMSLLQARVWCESRRDLALSEGGMLRLSETNGLLGELHA